MAREKITEEFQAKFDKPHFQSGSAVLFSWLGNKKYGYVTKFKKTNWGIQYTVQSTEGISYPCGICIDGTNTSYKVGIVYFKETKELGHDEIARRIVEETENGRVSKNTRRPTITSSVSDPGNGKDNDINNTTTSKQSGSNSRTMHDNESSDTRVHKQHKRVRKNSKSELNDAIEKQKNFLSGFIKKD